MNAVKRDCRVSHLNHNITVSVNGGAAHLGRLDKPESQRSVNYLHIKQDAGVDVE